MTPCSDVTTMTASSFVLLRLPPFPCSFLLFIFLSSIILSVTTLISTPKSPNQVQATASSTGMEDPSLDREAVILELIRGREFAAKLGSLLREASPGDSAATGALVEEVFGSISRALSALDSGGSPEKSQNPATTTGVGSVCSDERRIENSGGKRKIGPVGDRRGRCRKRQHPGRRVTSKMTNDGFSWRKYGQKEIQNAMYPRGYFRCTHKHDQGCPATKQVQKSEEDPSLFIITYIGEHTCRDPTTDPYLITTSNPRESSLISFGSNTSNITQEASLPLSSFLSKRQECDEEVISNLTPGISSSDYLMLPDSYKGSMLGPQIVGSASNHSDVTSGLHSSTSNLDMSFMVDSFEFEDDAFNFDQGEFLQG